MKTHEPQHHAIFTMEINGKEKSRCLNRSIIPPRVPLVKKNDSRSDDDDGYGRTTIALSSHWHK